MVLVLDFDRIQPIRRVNRAGLRRTSLRCPSRKPSPFPRRAPVPFPRHGRRPDTKTTTILFEIQLFLIKSSLGLFTVAEETRPSCRVRFYPIQRRT